jgi:hypothetical protein
MVALGLGMGQGAWAALAQIAADSAQLRSNALASAKIVGRHERSH